MALIFIVDQIFLWTYGVLRVKEMYIGILVKMVFFPLIVWAVLCILDLNRIATGTLVLFSALPTMTVIPMMAKNGGNGGALCPS